YELAGTGVLVNAVIPGNIMTEEGKKDLEALPQEVRSRLLHETMLGRFGSPDEVAGVVAFLASDAAATICGAALIVHGGWSVAWVQPLPRTGAATTDSRVGWRWSREDRVASARRSAWRWPGRERTSPSAPDPQTPSKRLPHRFAT